MYLPDSFKVDDLSQVEAFLQRYAFASIVSSTAKGMFATHVPVVVRRSTSGLVLVGHVARANSHWEAMDGAAESLAIFLGPHAYVSPSWYASGPAVPTAADRAGTIAGLERQSSPDAGALAAFMRTQLSGG